MGTTDCMCEDNGQNEVVELLEFVHNKNENGRSHQDGSLFKE